MLLGEAAPYARDLAERDELVFADAVEPGNGVVYAIGSTAGDELAFLDESGDKLVESAGCDADGVCGLETEGCEPEAEVTLAAYMPTEP